MLRSLILACCLLALGHVDAQERQPSADASATGPGESELSRTAAELAAVKEQNKLLQEHNRLLRDHQSALQNTVYWSLGFLGSVVAIIAGASWLVNFKLYDADKARLQQAFDARTDQTRIALAAQIETASSDTLRAVQDRLDALASRLSSEGIATRSEQATAISNLSSRIDGVDAELKTIPVVAKRLERNIHSLETTVRGVEEMVWDQRGVPSNVLLTQVQGLETAINARSEWQIKNVLERMLKTVEAWERGGKPMARFVVSSCENTLPKANEFAPVAVTKILEILRKIAVEA